VLPFWYRLTWVVQEKGPLNGCVCGVCLGSTAGFPQYPAKNDSQLDTLGSHDLQSWWERVPLVPNGGCAYDLRVIAITQRFLGPDLQTTILRLSYDNAEVNTIDLRRGRLYRVGRKPGCFESLLITLRELVGVRRHVTCQEFPNFVQKNSTKLRCQWS